MTVERSEPPYLQIARQIREQIESGQLAVGEPIPSARQIAVSWGVALATATKVQAHLRSEGLIESVPGVGSIVTAKKEAGGGRSYLKATSATGLIYAGTKEARILAADLVEASPEIAAALGLDPGASVVRRERVTLADGEPRAMSVSWLSGDAAERAPKLLETERIPRGTFAYLADTLGVAVTTGREQISATAADEAQARVLKVSPGSPVLLTRTWYVTDAGMVIEYEEGVSPEGQWVANEFAL